MWLEVRITDKSNTILVRIFFPFCKQEWGTFQYHNVMLMGIEEKQTEKLQDETPTEPKEETSYMVRKF